MPNAKEYPPFREVGQRQKNGFSLQILCSAQHSVLYCAAGWSDLNSGRMNVTALPLRHRTGAIPAILRHTGIACVSHPELICGRIQRSGLMMARVAYAALINSARWACKNDVFVRFSGLVRKQYSRRWDRCGPRREFWDRQDGVRPFPRDCGRLPWPDTRPGPHA